nr:hypothetical protein [Gemmatimonadales bacterium]
MYEICDTGPLCDTATVSISVTAIPGISVVEVQVASSSDDAEERVDGSVSLSSSDLELVYDGGGDQVVGMRFNGVSIPPGATISKAYVQFEADGTHSGPTSLTIQGEDVDNALTFDSVSGNISSRPRTSAAVAWLPNPWTTVGEAGPDQQTPDIASVIQEIVNRTGWSDGNSVVIIITGTGERAAASYNGDPAGAPVLHVEYTTGPPNEPPVANDDSASTSEDTAVSIDVAANDSDPEGTLDPASANTACGTCSEPANGTLVNNGDGTFGYTPDPGFSGTDSFVYEICDTGLLCDTATVSISVNAINDPPVANDDSASTTQDTAVTIDVAAN